MRKQKRSKQSDGRAFRQAVGNVLIYTDGCCLKNPGGAGGCAAVLLHPDGRREELSAGYKATTNNRMEIMAALSGLEALSGCQVVTVLSDSRYVVNAIQKKWAKSWRRRGWMRYTGEPALNSDLWQRMLDACDQHLVEFRWVPGHSGVTENERCDRLACAAAKSPSLIDAGYEGVLDAEAFG